MRIAIIGQGYVGKAFKEFVKGHYDTVTYDPAHDSEYPTKAINSCELAVVCVPTPTQEDGSCDTSIVESATERLNNPHILVKSTVPPGIVEALRKRSGKPICFSPEYIGESTYHNPVHSSMKDTPFVIVGSPVEERSYILSVFENIMGPHAQYFGCSITEAEIVKYMFNSYLAAKVTFVNEFYEIANRFGADWHVVREAWLLDERIGRAFSSVFVDKRGFGGKCLPKDVSAIVKAADAEGYSADLLKEVLRSNTRFQAQ